MKKNKIIIIAISMIMIGTGIFIACQKEIDDLESNPANINKSLSIQKDVNIDFVVAQKNKGSKVGQWPNRYCSGNEGNCWMWFQPWDSTSTIGIFDVSITIRVTRINPNNILMSIDMDEEGNNPDYLEGFVDFDNHLLEIQDDIFEDSPVFLELMETENVVKIIAGDYPYVQNGSIITATVPVEIQTYLPE